MSKENSLLLTSVDIGTTKVSVTVARPIEDKLEVIGFATVPHKGFHQGQIVDPQEVTSALLKAKKELEAVTGEAITQCWLAVSDNTISTVESKGSLAIKRTVKPADVDAIQRAAQEAAQVRSDREILHIIPQSYKWNGQRTVLAPLGEKTDFLEVSVLVLTGSRRNNDTARECLRAAGIECVGIVATSMALAEAYLDEGDRNEGVALIDIGGYQSELLCFAEGRMVHVASFPIGGVNFTQDLAIGLKTPQSLAEDIKKSQGAALVEMVSGSETISIERVRGEGVETLPVKFVSEILEARSEETLGLFLKAINDAGYLQSLKRGAILTGGASQLPGLPELGEFTFDIPFGRRTSLGVLSVSPQALGPVLAVTVGVLHYARKRQTFETELFSLDTFKDNWAKLKNYIENIL